MNEPLSAANSSGGVTLRQAALVAGVAYLLNAVGYAEFSIYPKLVVAGNADQTAENISAHHRAGEQSAVLTCPRGSS